MAEIHPHLTEPQGIDADDENSRWKSRARFLAWLVASGAFLGYLALGSVEARIWSFGRLFFQDRKIVHVWSYFGDRLPDMPASPLIPVLYDVSLAVMVVGTVLGLWYVLLGAEEPGAAPPSGRPETSSRPHQPGHTETHA